MAMATHNQRAHATARSSHDEPDVVTPNGAAADADEPRATVLEAGVYVDRYRIIDVIGTGGIGVVYAAFDDALARNVALKLLRPSSRNPRRLERRRGRLIREAQALARLSHPNVVPIYEVGMFEDRVFLAMEYVEGSTMRRWLRRSQRSWEDILEKYLQAGRGLAAAHRADIVHRDFKPDNVLVGVDERVRVLDFGLATPVPDALATGRYSTLGSHDQATSDIPTVRPLSESVTSLITVHGKIMGTPAYMAPEQSRGEATDARADQYSFCVALWEALFGERPQGPPTVTARVRLHRRLSERGASGADVPQSIQRALERGLNMAPDDRFPDMDSLLAALSRKSTSWRRGALAGGLGTIGVGVVGLLLASIAPDNAQLCPREDQALAGVWDEGVRERARAQLSATERPYADSTIDTIERELDRWSGRWLDARVDACEDTKVRQAQSPVLLDMRMACLDRQRNALAAVTESLAGGMHHMHDADKRLETALAGVMQLPEPERCERSALIGGGALMYEDPQQDQLLDQHRQQLARARGLLDMREHDDALALVDAVQAQVQNTPEGRESAPPLLAEAGLLRGQILAASGSFASAEHELRGAVFLGQTHGHDTVTVEASAALTDLLVDQANTVDLARRHAKLDSASDWYELGHATLARIGGDPQLEATLRFAGARLAGARGEFGAALSDQRRVLEIREQLYGPNHVEVAEALAELAVTQTKLELYPEAQADIERALKILTAEFGITHPHVGVAYARYAALEHARGAELDALSKQLDALAIFELAYGERHARVAETYAAIAATQLALGQPAQALAELEHARSISVELLGATDPSLAPMLVDLGRLLHALGRDDDALAELAAAEQLVTSGRGSTTVHVQALMLRGGVHFDGGRSDDALADYRLALELTSREPAPNERLVARLFSEIASVELQLATGEGELELALAHQREALELRQAALGEDAPQLALDLVWIGLGLVELQRFSDAELPLARALELLDTAGELPVSDRQVASRVKGRAHMALAKLAWSKPGQHPRARELARAAHDEFEAASAPAGRELDDTNAWLRLHGA